MTAGDAQSTPAEATTGQAPAPRAALAGVRILLAEDSEANRKLLTFCLERAGASVASVENGARLVGALADGVKPGARLIEPAPADIILTDIEMPELDGYSASRLLRDLGCALPIVALTAHSGAGDEERCRQAGCDAYATKPVDFDRLVGICERLLAKPGTGSQAAAGRPSAPHGEAAAAGAPTLRSQFADDPEMQELVASFTATLPEKAAALTAEHEAGRIDELARLAHQLKGIGGSYGFPSITEAARDVDYRARNGGDAEGLRRSVQRLVKLCNAAASPAAGAGGGA